MAKKKRVKKASRRNSTPRERRQPVELEIDLDVGRRNGRGTRTVEATINGHRHRDNLNTDAADRRRRFIRDLAHRAQVRPEDLSRLDQGILEAAARVDEEMADTPVTPSDITYQSTDNGLVMVRSGAEGSSETPLCNFSAEIIEDRIEDDGCEVRRVYRLRCTVSGRTYEFDIAACRFAGLSWVEEHLGASAYVEPGQGKREHVAVAIKRLSQDVRVRTIYRHTGWRSINGEMLYLHGAGAIGPKGQVDNVEVSLDEILGKYELPAPPKTRALAAASVQHVLQLLRLAPVHIVWCLLAAVFRAAMEPASDSTIWLAGRTGSGKSELVTRFQQFFGSGFDRESLPANWLSTGNSLEAAAHAAKNSIFVIDDFCPTGTQHDAARYNSLADRVIRAKRNGAGRQRMNPDGSLRVTKVPRGLIIGTGEDIPTGHSLRASMMIVELGPGDVDWERLTCCQQAGGNGEYATVTAGFVKWIAQRFDDHKQTAREQLLAYRERATGSSTHRRTPELVANLAVGAYFFLRFARVVGAITRREESEYFQQAWEAIGDAATRQEQFHRSARPELRFLELLCSALSSGDAHLVNPMGNRPRDRGIATASGWRYIEPEGHRDTGRWQPGGTRIGWVDGDDIYLDPDASYRVAQELARNTERISVAETTLHKRLHEAGLLASVDAARSRLLARRTLSDKRRAVLHLRAEDLCQG